MKKSTLLIGTAILFFATALSAGVTVTSPTHGDKWLFGSNKTVSFTTTTPYGDIYLLLYHNGVKIGFVKCGFPGGLLPGKYDVPWKVGSLTSLSNCDTPLTSGGGNSFKILFSSSPTGSPMLAESRLFSIIKFQATQKK